MKILSKGDDHMNKEQIRRALSSNLFSYRKDHKLSQEAMAELCSLSCRGYKDLEHGKRVPNLATALRLHLVTGIDLHALADISTQESE